MPRILVGIVATTLGVLLGTAAAHARDQVVLLPDADGSVGAIFVSSRSGGELLTDPNSAATLYYRYLGPYVSKDVSQADINARFGDIIGLEIAPDNPMDTLPEIVELTLATHPSIMQLVHERQARSQFAEEARRGFRPWLGLVGEAGYEWTRSPGTRARRAANGFDKTQFSSLPRREIGFVLRQKIFDGWETRSEVDRRVAAGDSSAYQLLARAERLSARVADAYLNLLRDNELLELANRNLATHELILERIEARTEAGVGRESDLDQAVGRLALAESQAVISETSLKDTLVSYISVVGYPPLEVLHKPEPSKSNLPATLDEALQLAVQGHPAIIATEADMAAAQDQIKNARSLLWPRLEIELGTRYGDDLDGVEGFDQDWTAMLLFSYNLYNGGADRSKIRRSLNVLEQARDLRERTVREVSEALGAW